jgi:hypothetical protein
MRINKRLLAACGVLGISLTAILWFRPTRQASTPDVPIASETLAETATREAQASQPSQTNPGGETSPGTSPERNARRNDDSSEKTGPLVTKPRLRDATTDKGGRRAIVDPLASWSESPPWPEGPKLYAEVDTPARRYINLRPNDIGIMPLVQVESKDPLTVTLSLPEASPGEKIYLELPNGGEFPGMEGVGRILPVSEARTLTFTMLADDSRGHCTLHVRHRGHTRTLPLWVGEPEAPAEDETPAS